MHCSASRRLFVVSFPLFLLALALSLLASLEGCSGGTTPSVTPAITSISPATLPAGSSAATLTISGSGFTGTSTVEVGGAVEATTYVSATQLTAAIPAAQLANGADLSVVVSNGNVSSTGSKLEVDNPAPAIASVSSTSELAGTASAVLTFTGSGFVPSTVINVNGSSRATTFISSTQVSAALPSTDFSAAGNLAITAVNPAPGGGTSAAATLAVSNPQVGAITVSPATLNTGSTSPATITVTGNGFVLASVIQVSGAARPTMYVNGNTLTFTATVADQAKAANLPVTVTNPAPGGGTSPVAYLSIAGPTTASVITSVSPNSIVTGSSASITIFGTGFTSSSVAQWNGANLPTAQSYSYNGDSYSIALVATVPASDLTTTGDGKHHRQYPERQPSRLKRRDRIHRQSSGSYAYRHFSLGWSHQHSEH